MKIGAYVQEEYAKKSDKNGCFNARQFIGLRVIIDVLQRNGFNVSYVGSTEVSTCDVVLVSITSDYDWWTFIRERVKWPKGNYKVIVGGAGVTNVRPFLEYADYFVLGRGEDTIVPLIQNMEGFTHSSIIKSKSFSMDKFYIVKQGNPYPFPIDREGHGRGSSVWQESSLGCPHKCLFCMYSWTRKCNTKDFSFSDGLEEQALLDIARSGFKLEKPLRTIAFDGCSERLRYAVNKKISDDLIVEFFARYFKKFPSCISPRVFNIVGYPGETEEDYDALHRVFKRINDVCPSQRKGRSNTFGIQLNSTPFRAMPLTPTACWPMPYRDTRFCLKRSNVSATTSYKGSRFLVQDRGGEVLATVFQSNLATRGTEEHAQKIRLLACSTAFERADSKTRLKTLERYFDPTFFFGEFTGTTLPTRNLRTYAAVERFWS